MPLLLTGDGEGAAAFQLLAGEALGVWYRPRYYSEHFVNCWYQYDSPLERADGDSNNYALAFYYRPSVP